MGKYVSTALAQIGRSCPSAKHVEDINAGQCGQTDVALCLVLTDIKSFTWYHTQDIAHRCAGYQRSVVGWCQDS
jgi:hypothetical protein